MSPPKLGSTIGPAPAFDFDHGSERPVATVQLGETSLSDIARRLGIDKDGLQQANPQISNPTSLKVGQQVQLPPRHTSPAPIESDAGPQILPSNSVSQSGPPVLAKGDPLAKASAQMRLAEGALPLQNSVQNSVQTSFKAPITTGQQVEKLAQVQTPIAAGAQPVQFTSKSALASNQRLETLARDPGEAHAAWKNLSGDERKVVLEKMETRYGKDFVQQFVEVAKKGKAQPGTQNYQPGTGPGPDRLRVLGYHLAWKVLGNAGVESEFWVHPSGKTIQRDVSTWTPGASQAPANPKSGSVPENAPPADGVDGPDSTSEVEDKQEKAESVLNRLQDNISQIENLLKSNPVPWEQVKQKFVRCNDLQGQLKELGAASDDPAASPTLDMTQVDEYFYDERDTANQQLLDLRTKAGDMNPDFESLMQQATVLGPEDE